MRSAHQQRARRARRDDPRDSHDHLRDRPGPTRRTQTLEERVHDADRAKSSRASASTAGREGRPRASTMDRIRTARTTACRRCARCSRTSCAIRRPRAVRVEVDTDGEPHRGDRARQRHRLHHPTSAPAAALRNLVARARELGGDCTIDSKIGGGTMVRWTANSNGLNDPTAARRRPRDRSSRPPRTLRGPRATSKSSPRPARSTRRWPSTSPTWTSRCSTCACPTAAASTSVAQLRARATRTSVSDADLLRRQRGTQRLGTSPVRGATS